MRRVSLGLAVMILSAVPVVAGTVERPEHVLGFKPGADYKLPNWCQIEKYFRQVAQASDRVQIKDLGPSSDGRPMVLAVISAAENLKELERWRQAQQQIADPRLAPEPDQRRRLVAESKIVVLVSCGLHSSECVSPLTATELLYELAAGDSPRTREILDNVIVLLVPSANPDGTDLVAEWYRRTLDKPWEGDGMPWLYHKYCGHDNNRDWFALNLAETRNLSRVLYQEWFPTIVLDLHQQSSHSVRMALPPYHNPISPNVPPLVNQAQLLLGGHMATELSRQGKTGVAYNVNYDLWYHGAFRSSPNRHNMVGILTEAASTRLASPIFIRKSELKGASRGLPGYSEAVNFSEPWPGGWWRPADILEYQQISTLALLATAARHRDLFQSNHRQMAEQAIALGQNEPPRAWLVPEDQADRGAAVAMLRSLHGTGIEVRRAEAAFSAGGVEYPAGTWIMDCAQPYRPHLMDMMERQDYPERVDADGKPEMPYDIAGWTLPLQMGVRAVAVADAVSAAAKKPPAIEAPQARFTGAQAPAAWLIAPGANDDYRLVNRLHRQRIDVSVLERGVDSLSAPAGSLLVLVDKRVREAEKTLLAGLGLSVRGLSERELAAVRPAARAAKPPRVALYQPWLPCMDEGWTRLVLEQFEFPYTSLHNAELKAGALQDRFDCIVLPSMSAGQILQGQADDATEPQYAGGIGEEGALRLQQFVAEGGWLVAIDDSCSLPIKHFNIPVRNALIDAKTGRPLAREQFFCPGSVLGVTLDADHALSWGRPSRVSAYFIGSQAFEIDTPGRANDEDSPARRYPAKVVARYADTLLLESGYLRGAQHLAGKPAMVEVSYGRGRLVLFGFRVQHRCHTHATFRLLFNALQASTQ